MKGVSLVVAGVLLLAVQSASAEEQIIPVPGEGWRIRFDAPKLTPTVGGVPSIFFGKADRFQLSFFVEPPRCPGGDSDENIYACWAPTLQRNPYVDWDTERARKTPNGVQVMYMSTGWRSLSIHLFFARHGKWADLHTSIASPKKEEVEILFAMMESVKIEEYPDNGVPLSDGFTRAR